MLTGRSAVDARPTVRQRNGGAGPINVCRVGLHVPAPSACLGSPSRLASFSLRQGGLVMKNEAADRHARAAVMAIFAIVLSVAMLAAFITTIEGEKHVSNSAHPGTIGLAKPHPPLDKAPGERVRN